MANIAEEVKALIALGCNPDKALDTVKASLSKAATAVATVADDKAAKAAAKSQRFAEIMAKSEAFFKDCKMTLVKGAKYQCKQGNLEIFRGITAKAGVVYFAKMTDKAVITWKGYQYFKVGYSLEGHPSVIKA